MRGDLAANWQRGQQVTQIGPCLGSPALCSYQLLLDALEICG